MWTGASPARTRSYLDCTLAVPNAAVIVAALTIMVGNTGGAIGDLYVVSRLLRLPRGILLRDGDPQATLVFEPERTDLAPEMPA